MEQVIATVVRTDGTILLDEVRVFLRADEPDHADGWGGYFTAPVDVSVEDGASYRLVTDEGRAGGIAVTGVTARPDGQRVGFRGSGPLHGTARRGPVWEPSDPIPIQALFAEDGASPNRAVDYRPLLGTADVIIGVDVMTRTKFLVYGRAAIEEMARTRGPMPENMVTVTLDRETEELDQLCALVKTLKGYHDYAAD
jgi:hypothetical protein